MNIMRMFYMCHVDRGYSSCITYYILVSQNYRYFIDMIWVNFILIYICKHLKYLTKIESETNV